MFVTGYLKESNQWSVVDTRNLMKKKKSKSYDCFAFNFHTR